MTDRKKLFIDTAPIIYFLDDISPYAELAESFFAKCLETHTELYTSVITTMEYLVLPIRHKDDEKKSVFHQLIHTLGIRVVSITQPVAEYAAEIRARYPSIKGMDAIQTASAIQSNCSGFITNDKQLTQIREIRMLLPKNWQDLFSDTICQ